MVLAEGESLGHALTPEIAPADNASLPGMAPISSVLYKIIDSKLCYFWLSKGWVCSSCAS